MFLSARRSVSLIKLVFFFVIFWVAVFVYMTTWVSHSTLLKNVQRENFQELVKSNLGHLLGNPHPPSIFLSKREKEIENFLTRLNLTNPGDMGDGVVLPESLPNDIKDLIEIGWKDYTINEFVSNLIPLSRSLPDPRDAYCRLQVYVNLPRASVIIIFHNEAWSMVSRLILKFIFNDMSNVAFQILRTMHSVLDRAPVDLLEEIILVDDCSDRG